MFPENCDLVIMACSGPKRNEPSAALDLYQGVMYSTFRANVRAEARPHVAILSARHGIIAADLVIEPYEQRLTLDRANAILADLDEYVKYDKPTGASNVLLAGSKEYRRVMQAALPHLVDLGAVTADATVTETTGGIGYQRQRLGQFLRGLAPAREIVGHHPNGTPLYQELGGFTVWQEVSYVHVALPKRTPEPAVIEELFLGPSGPTANLRMLNAQNSTRAGRWSSLANLHPR
jgi:hypothetical protein